MNDSGKMDFFGRVMRESGSDDCHFLVCVGEEKKCCGYEINMAGFCEKSFLTFVSFPIRRLDRLTESRFFLAQN